MKIEMKITCSKNLLLENLGLVSRVSGAKTTVPILECCLLVASKEGLVLTTKDNEMAIKTNNIESDVEVEGSIALDTKVFFDIVRGLPGPNIEIFSDEKNLTTIKSGKSEFKILGMDGADFPEWPQTNKNQEYKLPSAIFKNMIRQTVFSVSQDDSRPTLKGQLLDIKDGVLTLVAVDGFRISLRNHLLDTCFGDVKMVIPGRSMSELGKVLSPDADSFVNFYYNDNHTLFELENCTILTNLLEGEFLNYENMFSNETTTIITLDRAEACESIDRAMLISKDAKKSPVKLKIEESIMSISSNAELGSSYEEMGILQDGNNIEIAFNPKYLTEAMKVLDYEKITMSFTSPLSPCVIQVEGSDAYKYLVLPLRLRN
ncbi:MAG: DNA polymerase III subunit beta [Defluviitaleaceae bacterium]|nr:DNA polymerase III subunit beta [Defluviitaleaceae bacterium]